VKSRPGLSSFFTYATTIQITGYSLVYGTATFTYFGVEPTINEGFFLSGFTGNQSYLNGLEVYVETVGMTTFTVAISHADDGPINGLIASAVSSTGIFIGPNVGSLITGPSWVAPNNISSATAYASSATGVVTSAAGVSSSAANNGAGVPWGGAAQVFSTVDSFTTYATSVLASTSSMQLMVNFASLGLPTGAKITGVVVGFKAKYTGTGTVKMNVQLQDGNALLGTPVVVPLSNALAPYSKGSPAYLWGTTYTSVQTNSGAFGVALQGVTTGGTGTLWVNSATITVYYTLAATSGPLLDEGFAFAVALTSGISGFGVSFKAFSSASTVVTLQLLQAGLPVGTPKSVTLNGVSTLYNLGGPEDLWDTLWSAGNVNSTQFGVKITTSGTGTTSIGDLDVITYITPALENFNYVGSFEQNNSALTTFALDAAGDLWKEDVNNNPGVLSLALSGLLPNTFAKGATMNNQEFLMFSDLNIGTERPRLYTVDGNFYPVTQVGPGAPPSFQANIGSVAGIITFSSYAITSGVATFQYTPPGAIPTAGGVYVLSVPGTALDKLVVTVLSPGLSGTQFEANVPQADIGSTVIVGTATPTFGYGISSITQYPPYPGMDPTGLVFLLSAAAGSPAVGNNVTVYYNLYPTFPADPQLVKDFSSGNPVYVEIKGASVGNYNYNGIWLVTNVNQGIPPGHDTTHCFFTFTAPFSGSNLSHLPGSTYRETLATLTTSTPIPGLTAGSPITITGVTPGGWNATWTIVEAVHSGAYKITSTGYDYVSHVATYGFSAIPPSLAPKPGDLITVIGANNNAIFNGTFPIATVGASTFTVNNIVAPLGILPGQTVESQAQATTFGTVFTFDPGEVYQGTATDVIYGPGSGGSIAVIGSSLVPIGAGTRQAMCFFITASGNWTPASPTVTFDVSSNANELNVSNIPIGPPGVIGRGIAITEAGQNGVPGANFYVITEPVVNTVNGVTYTATIINDNTSTTAAFSFTDAVLLNSLEVDVQGNNLFSLIEIGSSAWSLEYSNRMFYGLQLNKVQNFNNLSFDGGYLLNPVGSILPLGWGAYPTANEITLVNSPVTGMALYISNTTGSIQPQMGMISQIAFQDPYKVAIIDANTAYSVRVACDCPSGVRLGTLVIGLVDLSNGTFGTTYGSFTVPLSSMTSLMTVFSGTLLPKGIFTGSVSPNLQLRVWVQNMGIGADVEIDRIEVFPTTFPFLKTEVYGSYVGKPESVDASRSGGILDTSIQNPQAVMGAFVIRDSMYLLKTSSMYVTKDNPNSEPGGWSIDEVSSRAGACGINAFDTGEEWAVTGCRNGLFGFDGGKVELLNLEVLQVWDAINWDAGNSIVIRNDIENRRIYCAVPLPTGIGTATVLWLPYAEYNPAPTTPNVILMLNYQSIGSFPEMMSDIGTHATMFGTLANPDMRRKWTIWQIPTPYMGTVLRGNLINNPIMICNGIKSSKIYELDPNRHDDDGATIWSLYTTYGFVNAVKAATIPIFGMHAKRYTILQATVEGAGIMKVRLLPNVIDPRYPYSIPVGIQLVSPANDDAFRSINVKGNRMFVEVSTNAVGAWFQFHKMLLTGKADHWSSLNPTGGMNSGIQ
jgi:hypothetical protein